MTCGAPWSFHRSRGSHDDRPRFLRYRREGGPRHYLIPDFLVAAHARIQADRLAATDRGYLRRYFPSLALLSPEE